MKNHDNIEEILRDSKPPYHDMSHSMHEAWQHVLYERNRYPKNKGGLLFIKPWMWALASVALILICVFYVKKLMPERNIL